MNVQCDLGRFEVVPEKRIALKKRPTLIKPLYKSKQDYRELLTEYREEISRWQNVLYAHDRYALLLIFQGMDTSGKDGAIKHVMSGVNPQGCQVFSFKQPSAEELDHDFLWRTNKCLPERGRIGIFNRSYYEDVLIARVEPDVLKKQRIPDEYVHPKRLWGERFSDIVHWEDYLVRNGTRIVKFFLHISKEEQRRRFLARIDDPEKNWKLTQADIDVRKKWNLYQAAYEDCLSSTSRPSAPWYIVPADDKRNARLLISKIIVDSMEKMPIKIPAASPGHKQELRRVRQALEKRRS